MTLGGLAVRPLVLQLGAGELRNVKPYGWKRAQGLKRLEDHFRFYHAYPEPFDLEGNYWNFQNAWIGRGGDADALRLWALGGGPKLLDIATGYADGVTSLTPGVWLTPEHTSSAITNVKRQLESKSRDPEAFDFALWGACLIHEDEELIEKALHNTTVRWLAAMVGRFNQDDWLQVGCEPPVSRDWHYATKLLPLSYEDPAKAREVLDRMPPEMVRKAFVCGTPKQVAATLAEHVEAGVTWVEVADMMPFVLEPQEAVAAVAHSIEVCHTLKQLEAAGAGV